ncbi:MauE/DoxX family redox-associated membrane protein [Actinomadura sp. NPDC047616]|uniref:MauE/DoxX family redox-associated membrane protein n=1 Tax=Actinomadura sp. NPDC047616 TaxID=3155914 RepID=UPI0033DC327A
MPSYLAAGAQAVVAVTFAFSAAAKLTGRAAYADFRRWLSTGAGVPSRAAGPLAAVTVAAEAATAAAAPFPAFAVAALAAATLLMAVFTVAVARMVRGRVQVPCRCFGVGRRPPGAVHVVRNAILLLVAAAGAVLAATAAGPPPPGQTLALTVIAGAAVALLLIDLEELVFLVRPVRPGSPSR